MRVIATAGHVDHGKSTLIRTLTGMDPDRLREEKERGMTIDLGFAWLRLPAGEEVGIVDVPGHQDFIRNMLAGVGAIDAALLVVALDEGVMPQTREHLAILRLLGVERGVIALTKRDLVDDEWAALVREEVTRSLAATPLAAAPAVEVSAASSSGLDLLLDALERVLHDAPPHRDLGRPRLPIDRAFTIAGFGSVVTGTLRDGSFSVGDEVEIVPGGKRARVRGLQTHRQKIEVATPGRRVAMNLSGLDVSELRRGMVVTHPGALRATSVLTARIALLADASRPLAHDDTVKLYVGTTEEVARVSILGASDTDALPDEIGPGEAGWTQLRLAEPVAALVGDRFVIRYPSPGETIGGGVIVDVVPRRLRRRSDTVRALERRATESIEGRVHALLEAPATKGELAHRVDVPIGELEDALDRLKDESAIVELTPFFLAADRYEEIVARVSSALAAHEGRYPLRRGMSKEELRTGLGLEAKLFQPLIRRLVAEGRLVERGSSVARPEHVVRLAPEDERAWERAKETLGVTGAQPPTVAELGLGPEVVAALAERGELVRIGSDLVLLPETARRLGEAVIDEAASTGHITVARARDLTGSSRKYVLPLLQFLDDVGVTRRSGEDRLLVGSPADAKLRLARAIDQHSEVFP